MKKILLSAMVMAMMACGTAFAGATGNAFSMEEDVAINVIRNMVGGSRANAIVHFLPDMAEKYTEEAHKQSVANIAKEFGSLSNLSLVQATRNYDASGNAQSDGMLFLANGSTGKTVAINILFIPQGKQSKVAAVGFRPVEVRRQ